MWLTAIKIFSKIVILSNIPDWYGLFLIFINMNYFICCATWIHKCNEEYEYLWVFLKLYWENIIVSEYQNICSLNMNLNILNVYSYEIYKATYLCIIIVAQPSGTQFFCSFS